MTQHNAALVEETNAAIEQTESQAVDLDKIVERFVLPANVQSHVEMHARPKAAPVQRAKPANTLRSSSPYLKSTGSDSDWEQF